MHARPALALALLLLALGAPSTMGSHDPSSAGEFHIVSVASLDDDADGYLDNVTVTFSDPMDWTDLGSVEDWQVVTLEGVALDVVSLEPLGADGLDLVLHLQEDGPPDTGPVLPMVYTGAADGLKAQDAGLDFDGAFPMEALDRAGPVPVLAQVDAGRLLEVGDEAEMQPVFVLFSEGVPDADPAGALDLRYVSNGTSIPLVAEGDYAPRAWWDYMGAIPALDLALPINAYEVAVAIGADEAGNPGIARVLPLSALAYATVTPTESPLRLNETGTQTTREVFVRLTVAPRAPLVLEVYSGDESSFLVDRDTLTFTPANFATPQAIRVTAVDDHVLESFSFGSALVLEVDPAAWGTNPALEYFLLREGLDIPVHVRDTTKANVTASVASLSLSEAATSQVFTARLTAKPATGSKVVLDVAVTDATEAAVNRTRLTFGPGNWSTPQSVKVSGVDDRELDGSRALHVTLTVNDTVAGRYQPFDAVPARKVAVTVADNDTAALVVDVASASISEPVGEAVVRVKLAAKPDFGAAGTVRVRGTSSDPQQFTSSPTNFTFTASDWDTYKSFSVRAIDDKAVEGLVRASLTLAVEPAHTLAAYDGAQSRQVPINLGDDEVGVIRSVAALAVREGGPAATYDLRLSTAPATPVTLAIAAGANLSATPSALTFGPGNWSAPQSVAVTVVDDAVLQGNRTVPVTHTVTAGPPAFKGLAALVLPVAVEDEDDDNVTIAALAASNGGITVQVTRSGKDNVLSWVLPADPPAPVVGVQVWRGTATGYVLAATLAADSPGFKASQYRDDGAPGDAKYRVTSFYGRSQALGFSADGKSASVTSFDALQAVEPEVVGKTFGTPVLILFGFVAAGLLTALVVAIRVASRR